MLGDEHWRTCIHVSLTRSMELEFQNRSHPDAYTIHMSGELDTSWVL